MDRFGTSGYKRGVIRMNPEPLRGIINKDRKDADFSNIGVVHPSEYNWEEQMLDIKKQYNKDFEPYVEMDVGKILGLCKYIKELESGLKSVVEFYKKYLLSGMRFLSKDEPEIWEKYMKYCKDKGYKEIRNLSIYSKWLFDYCFSDVIK